MPSFSLETVLNPSMRRGSDLEAMHVCTCSLSSESLYVTVFVGWSASGGLRDLHILRTYAYVLIIIHVIIA